MQKLQFGAGERASIVDSASGGISSQPLREGLLDADQSIRADRLLTRAARDRVGSGGLRFLK
jgi:hypothetical protein